MRVIVSLAVLATTLLAGDPSKGAKVAKPFAWRQFYGNAAHDNYRARPDGIRWPTVLWHVPGATGQPTVADGLVYSGGDALRVIDAKTGKLVAERKIPDIYFIASPVLSRGRVIARRRDGTVECHTRKLEKLIWTNEDASRSQHWTHPALLVGGLHIAAEGSSLVAIGVDDGKRRWVYRHDGGAISMAPASDGKRVFVGSEDGRFLALDVNSGAVKWRQVINGARFGYSHPAVIDGRVLIGDRGIRQQRTGRLHCFDPTSGKAVWAYDFGATGLSTPGHAPGVVLLGYGISLATVSITDGRPTAAPIKTGANAFGSPTLVGETIYFGNLDGNLYAYDRKSRQLKWRFEVPGTAASGRRHQASHFVHTGRRIYLATSNGLYCLAQDPNRKGKLPQGERITAEASE